MSNYEGPEWSQEEQDELPRRFAAGDNLLDSYIDQWLMCQAAREPLRNAEDSMEALREISLDKVKTEGPLIYNGRKLHARPGSKVVVAEWLKERVLLTSEDVAWTVSSASEPFFVLMPFGGWPKRNRFIPNLEIGQEAEVYVDSWLKVSENEDYKNAEFARKELSANIKLMVVEEGAFAYRDFMFLKQQYRYVNPTPEAKEHVAKGTRRYMGLTLENTFSLICAKAPKL